LKDSEILIKRLQCLRPKVRLNNVPQWETSFIESLKVNIVQWKA